MATTRSGPGRPALGERTRMTVRVPSDVYDALRREAKARGISMNQYVAEVAAAHLGMPKAVSHFDDQEAIPA
ncbi:toxin-antitoxin system HicB family antitoxin [Dietzia maris]|uniref:Toxin-antitoxin system HicB family antitoxin n=2 Tax=Dietzia maris TaxID=37915 RepID=A0A365P8W8_9ACTN|nr:toxin-antitoxin system HicB family antitoxin [Dietzia maris]